MDSGGVERRCCVCGCGPQTGKPLRKRPNELLIAPIKIQNGQYICSKHHLENLSAFIAAQKQPQVGPAAATRSRGSPKPLFKQWNLGSRSRQEGAQLAAEQPWRAALGESTERTRQHAATAAANTPQQATQPVPVPASKEATPTVQPVERQQQQGSKVRPQADHPTISRKYSGSTGLQRQE